jgi:hypothetical protein
VLREFEARHCATLVELVSDDDAHVSLQVTDDHDLFVQTDMTTSTTTTVDGGGVCKARRPRRCSATRRSTSCEQLAGAEGGFAPSAETCATHLSPSCFGGAATRAR